MKLGQKTAIEEDPKETRTFARIRPTSFLRSATFLLSFCSIAMACSRDRVDVPSAFFGGSCSLDATLPCADCLDWTLETTLGDSVESEADQGFLEDRGTLNSIVRDQVGNYWIGQRETIKIFSPTGDYLQSVGRAGQGPMEFDFAQPMYVDSAGLVHVFDIGNRRVSKIDSSLGLIDENMLPVSSNAMVAIAGGEQYAIQAWIPTADRIGFPLHIIEHGDIIHSFGVETESDQVDRSLSDFTARRFLAVDSNDNIFSSHHYDLLIEAWSSTGQLVGRMEGPPIHDGSRTGGAWTDENPPWHRIYDIHIDDRGYLRIAYWYRRPDWRENMTEKTRRVVLAPSDGTLQSYYHSRIDVVDVDGCKTIASQWREPGGLLMAFVDDDLLAELNYTSSGETFLKIWRVSLNR